ncbi:MAG: hypothetical protein KC800_20000, partial [Candidatus Eremiobacteraeota bacterium]|nr:hypothetical protein [Candidatus Eremiobacteraeota bacterium]
MLRSLPPNHVRGPARFALRSSPPRLLSQDSPLVAEAPQEDLVELSKPNPEKTGFGRRLGQVALGVLGLSGAVVGTVGVVTGVAEVQRMRSCECETLSLGEKPVFEGDIQQYSDALVRYSLERAPDCEGRHRVHTGRLIQSEDGRVKYDGSEVVVIAFDGTFGHDPRRVPVMQQLTRELQAQGIDTQAPDFRPADIVGRSITSATGKDSRWSGLHHGILQQIVRDPELNQNVQLLTFPSEELEVLADKDAWKEFGPIGFTRQVYDTAVDRPANVEAALLAVTEIRQQALEQGRSPKFVVLSHSSGGASAVKFSERLQATLGEDVQIDLVASIDPVKEAHFAVGEALAELGAEGYERVVQFLTGRAGSHTPTVRSHSQPKTLHTTENVAEWINFYQTGDTLGIKAGPQMGIHGSPVSGAENVEVDGLGSGGHGSIAINGEVLNRVLGELRERLR